MSNFKLVRHLIYRNSTLSPTVFEYNKEMSSEMLWEWISKTIGELKGMTFVIKRSKTLTNIFKNPPLNIKLTLISKSVTYIKYRIELIK